MEVANARFPSEAIFKTALAVTESWGVPISASADGLMMDVDRNLNLVKALDGNADTKVRFFLASGMNSSALEHSVPERLLSTADNPVVGVSAVKAIQIAVEQGLPIYTVTADNAATVLPQLSLDSAVIGEIQNAVNAGKEVTVSQTDIDYEGFTGCGYIIIDPATGEGAYMISGGEAGAMIFIGLFAPYLAPEFYAYMIRQNSEYLAASFHDMCNLTLCTISVIPGLCSSCTSQCESRYGADAVAEYKWCVAKALISMAGVKAAEKGAESAAVYFGVLTAASAEMLFGIIGIVVLEVEITSGYGQCNANLELGLFD